MQKKLDIAYLGHDILRSKTTRVDHIEDKAFQEFIDHMIYTVKAVNGLGIAAPQVYKKDRVFIMASKPSERYPNAPTMAPIAIINPEIIKHSKTTTKDWEGCLSIPGIRGLVPRYDSITVKYTNRFGALINSSFTGFIARIFQHEIDHLNGLVFLDRLETNKDIIAESEYQKIINTSL